MLLMENLLCQSPFSMSLFLCLPGWVSLSPHDAWFHDVPHSCCFNPLLERGAVGTAGVGCFALDALLGCASNLGFVVSNPYIDI